ncbi:craniofacial development protein 2 [Elysia marginata]|uniref:Craniofacial development protein 2 n=1 Tax=Elysia marginata TaxID=1093978 RepID=A0AAV4FNC1_9GAST|nr:craniofacial development protein 2 [Elysia marginata]
MTIRLKTAPFNATGIQVYAPTTDNEVEVADFYNEVQKTLNEVPKKDIKDVQVDWNARTGEDAKEHREGHGDNSAIRTQTIEGSNSLIGEIQ